jgi:chaperonin GroES
MAKASEPVYRPLGDKVVIRREKAPDKIGNIHIPESAQGKMRKGFVLAVGPGKLLDDGKRGPMELKEGQKVCWSNYAGSEVGDRNSKEEEDILVMREDDILAVVVKE